MEPGAGSQRGSLAGARSPRWIRPPPVSRSVRSRPSTIGRGTGLGCKGVQGRGEGEGARNSKERGGKREERRGANGEKRRSIRPNYSVGLLGDKAIQWAPFYRARLG